MGFEDDILDDLQGQTLTFKEIIDLLEVEGLSKFFTSNADDFNLVAGSLCTPPISLSKFLHQGVIEAVERPTPTLRRRNCLIS